LIKANYLFVFHDTAAPSPLYAIPLDTLQASLEDPSNPSDESYTISPAGETNMSSSDLQTVLLQSLKSHKVLYQVTFNVKDTTEHDAAQRFVDIVNSKIIFQSINDPTGTVKPTKSLPIRLDADALAKQTQSIMLAENVAASKVQHQPIEFHK